MGESARAINNPPARKTRVAIVGSGFGGLASAIRLQAAGYDCTIFEARDKPGGRAYVYEQNGFHFDGGPTVITAPECLEELFSAAGQKLADHVQLLPVQPFYRLLWPDGVRFDYDGDPESLVRQIRKLNPSDVEGYERFYDYSRRVFDKGYTELVDKPFLSFRDMLAVAPDLARLRADRSVYKTVSRFIDEEHLRQAFSFHSLLVGGNPFETSSIYTLIHYLERNWGVFFPKGGTGALVQAMVRLFEQLGGQVHLGTAVEGIEVVGEKRCTRHEVSFHQPGGGIATEAFDLVVSNADIHHTYNKLYRTHPAAAKTTKRLEKSEWSMSLFVLYFGADRPYDDVAHHTVLFGPRYRELLQEIFRGPTVPEDFSLYLHAPCVTDPSMAPTGCSSFYVLSPVPHLGNAAPDWETLGERYADKVLDELHHRVLPGIKDHLVAKHFITPLDFQRDLFAYQGSAFSVAPRLTQSAYFRPHNRDAKIPGLYIAGAGTHPGAGLPGVINSAKATTQLIVDSHPPEEPR